MKQKRAVRLFALSFFCTLAAAAVLCGFAVADQNTRRTGYGDFIPMAAAERIDPLHYDVSVLGEEYVLSLEWLNTAARWGQRVAPYLPAAGRLGIKLAALGARAAGFGQ